MARVTISDIAKGAGVSKTTVSFAFNTPERLPADTVQRILKVAEELGYVPNPIARSMTSNRTGNIGLLFPQPVQTILNNPYTLELLQGIGQVCDAHGLNIVLVSPRLGNMRQAVSAAVVDGFLTIGLEHYKSTIRLLEQREIPYVMVDSDPHPGAICVNIDDETGAYAAMRHVLEQGHRDIVILGIESGKHGRFDEYVGTIRYRMRGYQRALAEFGLTLNGERVRLVECPCTAAGGANAFDHLLREQRLPTAFVAMADILAVGLLETSIRHGLSVPKHFSIVGFDDLPIARWLHPPLTTVTQPVHEKGVLAAELLRRHMAGEAPIQDHVLPTRLIERRSVASLS
ncbi:MAG: LacI family DNA-binding transcriptional regulator [Chloroflexi bacterium]|uniref:LacI family DNA-binding transcriptional regulator n=1 Tax=Candidatus Flexifilum breve TaxID=3140694 RepID=UPI003136C6BF|nr:LacI family DNA-binding transcriptional regulator [Chloroflexota bacterium]MBK9747577.1 LacI family DNA-binding transcriptional regulator [Chloroflexota bacterium]